MRVGQCLLSSCLRAPVQVLPGARMPVDGLVASGQSHADESMLTGEAEPVLKDPGDAVIGGTMNLGGALHVRLVPQSRQASLHAWPPLGLSA